jgi:hypothetical protein
MGVRKNGKCVGVDKMNDKMNAEEIKNEIEKKGMIINNFFLKYAKRVFAHDYGKNTNEECLEIFDIRNNTLIVASFRDNMKSFIEYKKRENYYISKNARKIEIADISIQFDNFRISIVNDNFRISYEG